MNSTGINADPRLNGEDEAGGSVASTAVATVGSVLNLGARARLVALENGLSLQILAEDGATWVTQNEWVEDEE